ncbi:MAG: SPFH domain-containing protein, partial [Clostridia bacterium]|nr:SPFH domain-containing protein [Clostridia bacterium]
SKIPALDLAANYDELSSYTMKAINPKIAPLGLTLCSFVIENISLPEEVEKSMDKRTSMGVLGNLDQYAKYQAAEAMRDAASNGNGMAGMGVGMGAGAAMGQMFAQSMNPGQPAAAAPVAPAAGAVCSACGAQSAAGAKFCPECGAKQAAGNFCTACGAQIPAGTKFCPECGAKQ